MRDIDRTLNHSAAVGRIFHLADGTIQSCNANACKILGYSFEELVGSSSFELPWQTIQENDSIFFLETHPAIASIKTVQPFNNLLMGFYRSSGDLIRLSINTLPLCKANSNELYGVEVSFINLTQDTKVRITPKTIQNPSYSKQISNSSSNITHGKQKKITITESEQRLKLATDAAGIGMWFWDLVEDVVEWTELGKAIFGLPLDEEPNFEKCFKMIHLEDRNLVQVRLNKALANQTQYSIEYRIVRLDGSVHWIAAKGRGIYNENGEPVSMIGIVQDISDRKETEQKLEENEQLLRLALKNAKAGLWDWDLVSQEVTWSPENYELYGIDSKIKPLHYRDWEHTLHPDDLDASNQEIQKVLSGESKEFGVEFRIIHPQKGIRWIWGIGDVTCNQKGEPIRLSGLNLDITSLKETEAAFLRSKQALEQREYELELITEVIPQQIWTAGKDGQIDYINQRWQNYTGLNLAQMRRLGWATIVHFEDLPIIRDSWIQSIQTGENFDVEARLRNVDGTYRWFLSKARPLRNEQGEIIKWYGTNTNINRIKELEEKLRQQTKDLIQANQLKDDFLAIVSHELRTPLNPILGWSQLLSGGKLDADKIAQGIGIIERNAKLQAQLIDDLLDVSRILRGKLELKVTPLNLELVIRAALTTVQLAAEAKSIQIETIFESNIGQVSGDAGRLQQIVWNLVVNAVKFTPANGRVFVKLKKAGTQAVIEIRDTGKGIEPEFIPYVFDRFRQENSANTREFGGLGLGLAIVKHLTELHGGTVAVSSPGLNRGAKFSVKLPLINTSISESININPLDLSAQPSRFKGLTMLVVDDEADSLDILTFVLEEEGAEVISVASAPAALSVFSQITPDLIVSDIGMPNTDGYTLMKEVRKLPQGLNIPAIALTAYAGEIDIQQSLDAGFQKHLAKPINIPQLIKAISELL
ncbi:hybrid sensor histidine kinase/response regulator [Pleurocapsa sp. PCC 7319]|uniref:hybrid sensor histidine kinase/response regulator n=1 Tax=Pleurocapsa sp. PCC 7319 TaxID=118161 RepID=UPI00034C5C13|nr:hybrid sensor histidine kinase/response regulator [Pleurocapsa sp. PCC 7319]